MKAIFVLFTLITVTLNVCAQQVEINRPILLSGTIEADRRIVNLGTPIQLSDAANAQAVQSGKLCFATATGSNNAFNLTLTPAATQYVTGMVVNFKAPTSVTGNATLNVNSLSAKPLLKASGAGLVAGDILQGQMVCAAYDGNNFQMLTPVSSLVLSQNGVDYDSFKFKVGFNNVGANAWTVPANITSVMVEVWGAGGGGGSAGCSACSSDPTGGAGGGGGAGGYGRELLAVAPGASFTIVVGAGGLGISVYACGQTGGAGGTTSFGSLVSATGGQGGGVGQFRPFSNCGGSGLATGAAGLGGSSSASTNLTGASGSSFRGGTSFVAVVTPPTVPTYLQNYVGTFKSFNVIKPAPGAGGNFPNPSPGNTYPPADGKDGFVLISY